jgi:hypothetical protein
MDAPRYICRIDPKELVRSILAAIATKEKYIAKPDPKPN